ncbi:hypothetical protein [Streptomyces sp. NPDC007088]|uniref:hypothetical protein n=1 Tax=Streptomyces sp. NPDC007088 TaxID=3364773 RepID=UPI0036A0F89E
MLDVLAHIVEHPVSVPVDPVQQPLDPVRSAPPRKPRPGALPGRIEQCERDLHGHSSDRITVEHALADHKSWKQLTRWTHRRDRLPDTYRAIAGLVSDRTHNN